MSDIRPVGRNWPVNNWLTPASSSEAAAVSQSLLSQAASFAWKRYEAKPVCLPLTENASPLPSTIGDEERGGEQVSDGERSQSLEAPLRASLLAFHWLHSPLSFLLLCGEREGERKRPSKNEVEVWRHL